jgi:DNA polymerase eta
MACFFFLISPGRPHTSNDRWNSVLAVTYPAREYGIKRGDTWDAVAEKSNHRCIAIHLPLFRWEDPRAADAAAAAPNVEAGKDEQDTDHADHPDDDDNILDDEERFEKEFHLSMEEQQRCLETENGVQRHNKEGKASLERYRLASRVIFSNVLKSLKKHVKKGFVLEKASIDEFYLDITEYCYGKDCMAVGDDDTHQNNDGVEKTIVIGKEQTELGDLQDSADPAKDVEAALQMACQVSSWIRNDVWNNLGFTMSAGISTNKTMAKLAASFGKPNGQAVLFPQHFSFLMAETKVRKVRNFGGKLGKKVLDLLYSQSGSQQSKDDFTTSATMRDLSQLSLPLLQKNFSAETAQFVFQACQGIDNEEVTETSGALVKSITAFKSFTATASNNKEEVHSWLKLLAKEIAERVAQDAARNHRYPKTCTLNYSFYTTSDGKRLDSFHNKRQTRSLRLAFPPERVPVNSQSESLVEQSMTKLTPILKECLVSGIGLSAGSFESRGQPPEGNASIESFFKVAPTTTDNSTQQSSATKTAPTPDSATNIRKKISDRTSNKRARTGFYSFFSRALPLDNVDVAVINDEKSNAQPSITSTPKSSAADTDLELAKKLQASFDRENYVYSKVNQRKGVASTKSKANKQPKTMKIDAFFTKR